ncbi:MAG: hypothetical protein KIT10_10730 [Flavobacteriales bacterium]|nr:hypothetical protein [Flavobacteriales bacterium]
MEQRAAWTPFLLVAAAVWAYVLARAAFVPWINDEGFWLNEYAHRHVLPGWPSSSGGWLPAAIGVASHKLLGLSLFWSRIGSVLAFPLFAWAAFHLGARLQHKTLRWATWLALLTCPFLLDFFSLFGGHGPATAFWALALLGALRYRDRGDTRALGMSLGGLLLASLSLGAYVIPHAIALLALAAILIERWRAQDTSLPARQAFLWLSIGLVPLVLFVWNAAQMHNPPFGDEDTGLVRTTLASLSAVVLGNDRPFVLLLVVAILLGATLVVPLRAGARSPLALLAALLWADLLVRSAMRSLFGIDHPEDHQVPHLVPLAILLTAFAADDTPEKWGIARRIAIAFLFFLPLRTLYVANLDHTLRWPEQSVPTRFVERLYTMQRGGDRPLSIGAGPGLALSIPHAAKLLGLPVNPPDTYGFPEGPHDVRIAARTELREAAKGFVIADSAAGPGLYLLLPKPSLRTGIFARHVAEQGAPAAERFEILRADTLRRSGDVLVELKCGVDLSMGSPEVSLVVEVERDGEMLHRHTIGLSMLRDHWQGEELHLLVRLPHFPQATSRVVYFENNTREAATFGPVEVKLHRILTHLPH